MAEHKWTTWDLYVTCLLLSKDANDNADEGINVSYDDEALRSDADRLLEFFTSKHPDDIDNLMQVYGMHEKGTVEERIEAATELYKFIAKKTGN
jgi:hypothetical protein